VLYFTIIDRIAEPIFIQTINTLQYVIDINAMYLTLILLRVTLCLFSVRQFNIWRLSPSLKPVINMVNKNLILIPIHSTKRLPPPPECN
jgi:hypothetical protein